MTSGATLGCSSAREDSPGAQYCLILQEAMGDLRGNPSLHLPDIESTLDLRIELRQAQTSTFGAETSLNLYIFTENALKIDIFKTKCLKNRPLNSKFKCEF